MTKDKKIQLDKTHKAFLDAMLMKIPEGNLDGIVVQDVMGYGTTVDEKVFDIEGIQRIIKLQKEQSADMQFSFTVSPVHKRIAQDENAAVFVDELIISMQLPEGKNEFMARVSTVLNYIAGSWKVVHWHGSKPVDTESDTWHREEWKKKNEELQRLVEKKTTDLKQKNRELEIEAALERIRTIAMGMANPSDLQTVCEKIYMELKLLGFQHLRNTIIDIFNDETKSIINYEYSDFSGAVQSDISYTSHPAIESFMKQIRKTRDAFAEVVLSNTELQKLRSNIGDPHDPQLEKSADVYYYFYSIGFGSIGISSYESITKVDLEILERFRNIFKLAYGRYNDIALAQEQAREAQIEAALERVRARSMAMHQTTELQDVINIVHQQFKYLDMDITGGAFIAINSEIDKEISCWGAGGTANYIQRVHIPFLNRPIYTELGKGIKKGPGFFSEEYTHEEKIEFFKHLFKHPPYSNTPTVRKNEVLSRQGGYARACVVSKHTSIFIINHHGRKFSDADIEILNRFEKVFEQAYTRFLDLKKAEAQAREARIEASLERVRAKTMAMHKSEDLSSAITAVFSELEGLGFKTIRCGIGIFNDKSKKVNVWTASDGGMDNTAQLSGDEILEGHPLLDGIYDAYEKQEDYSYVLEGEDLKDYYKVAADSNLPVSGPKANIEPVTQYYHCVMFPAGGLFAFKDSSYTDEARMLMRRFADLFHLTFIRHLDLMQAEAQAREAQVELSLERIRAQATAMKESSDLLDIVVAMNAEFNALGHEAHYFWHMRWLPESYEKAMTSGDGSRIGMVMQLPRGFHENAAMIEWEKNSEPSLIVALDTEGAIDYVDKMIRLGQFSEIDPNAPGPDDMRAMGGLTFVMARTTHGEIGYTLPGAVPNPPAEDITTLVRFAGVFDLAYRRFEDLKSAERQNRETQIELALERVRARTMAMQSSHELREVAQELREQMGKLNQKDLETSAIHLYPDQADEIETWYAIRVDSESDTQIVTGSVNFKVDAAELIKEMLAGYKSKEKDYTIEASGDKMKEFFAILTSSAPKIKKLLGNDPTNLPQKVYYQVSDFSGGSLVTVSYSPPEEETKSLQRRSATVFDLAYRRFLDLKNKEEQFREAQIEASLERIRAKALSMQQSSEVGDVNDVLFDEFEKMGIDMIGCGISVIDEETDHCEQWRARRVAVVNSFEPFSYKKSQEIMAQYLPKFMPELINAWDQKDPFLRLHLKGKERDAYLNAIATLFNYRKDQKKEILSSYPKSFVSNFIFFKRGWLSLTTMDQLADDEIIVSRRFVDAFDFAHTRFMDLKKAEEQAREAQIEAALERVRSKAMAMHSSEDLGITVDAFFSELRGLNVSPHRCGVGIVDGESRIARIHATDSNQNKEINKIVADLKLAGHPVLENIFEHWKLQKEYFPVLRGDEIKAYYKVMNPQVAFHEFTDDEVQYGYYFYFQEGHAYAWTDKELQEQEIKIFRRFTSVLSLTYRRYMDLKDAEAQAREAVKQSSLDRVRGEIASMRTSEDLKRITPLLWQELETLEVPFIRCGVFIVDEPGKTVHVYLTTPDGNPLGALHLPFNATDLTKKAVEYWYRNEVFTRHWSKNSFVEWMQSMIELGQVSKEEYLGGGTPPESLELHFIPFEQGMIYVGNTSPLEEVKIELVQSLAETFSIAYARYEDFQNLESAKDKVEKTLSELKSAQAQLIHAEKMASLGELTAGIAHEIQNPLNFVNNFSEVSVDLLDELKEELAGGSSEDVMGISEDLKQNLEKITHHGKRASSIVKGMLEHSRAGSGHKELANVNEMADEYLRLAYHGLRAKDKSFNAGFETNLDESMPTIKVIPQDIGRVLLNLINNAFYACTERSRNGVSSKTRKVKDRSYKPMVTVTTKDKKDFIEIRIKDNGAGIPKEIEEKIFQPFFSTKPTGEGTGLGLSLSYDIVTKGHGGNLDVVSREGEGTEFIIQLLKG